MVRVLPVATNSELAAASVLAKIEGSLVKVPSIKTISLLVGTAPVLQFVVVAQSLLVVPVQDVSVFPGVPPLKILACQLEAVVRVICSCIYNLITRSRAIGG